MRPAGTLAHDAVPKLDEHRMNAELQHVVDAMPGLGLHLGERIEVPGVDDQGLLANHVCTDA